MHPTRIFKKPEELGAKWEEYKASLIEEAKKWGIVQYVGKNGERMEDYPKLPIILKGFYGWCLRNNVGTVHQYFDNSEGLYDEFLVICTRVRDEVEVDHITGGLIGKYNSSITQRLHGLAERNETNVKANVNILNVDPLDDSTDNSTP